MKTINLDQYDLIKTKVTSSKGNQQKWLVDGKWYKADHMGYEALCEVVVSRLMLKSNVKNFVEYFPIKIEYDGKTLNGCFSENFKAKNESIVTLEHLAKQWLSASMAEKMLEYTETEERIKRTVSFIEEVTGLKDVGKYLTMMLELDASFLNEDRHTNNIAFILNDETGEYRLCPYFDFGLSLLADTTNDYPMDKDIYQLIKRIKAKPFNQDFDIQLDAAQKLYGNQLKFNFNKHDVYNALDEVREYYDDKTMKRAEDLLLYQMHKYGYLFDI